MESSAPTPTVGPLGVTDTTPPLQQKAHPGVSGWAWAVAVAWYVQVATFVLVGLGAGALPSVRGLIGVSLVGADVHRPWGVLFVGLGLASALFGVFVLMGHGFALRGLACAGAVGSLGLALLGSWTAFLIPVVMLVAVALTLLTPALDHFEPTEPGAVA